MNSEHHSPLLQIMIQCTMLRCKSTFYYGTYMVLEQAYWHQRQAAGSWTGGLIYATGSPPSRKSTVAYTSRLFINHCGPIMPASSMDLRVRDVELEEKDTEGGDKDNVQLDDLTDRVILWLT